MKRYQKKRVVVQAKTILFCAALIWMAVSFLAAVPAMAFQTPETPEVLQGFEHIVEYQDYAYASSSEAEAVAYRENGGKWQILCQHSGQMKTIELVNRCQVPAAIARHLKVLSKAGVNHEIFMADI